MSISVPNIFIVTPKLEKIHVNVVKILHFSASLLLTGVRIMIVETETGTGIETEEGPTAAGAEKGTGGRGATPERGAVAPGVTGQKEGVEAALVRGMDEPGYSL